MLLERAALPLPCNTFAKTDPPQSQAMLREALGKLHQVKANFTPVGISGGFWVGTAVGFVPTGRQCLELRQVKANFTPVGISGGALGQPRSNRGVHWLQKGRHA